MLTFTDKYTGTLPYPYEKLGNPPGLLFFDIETTGLSARTSQLYLIGSLFTDGTSFFLHQWFAQGPDDEPAVLTAFQDYLASLPKGILLLHFNGNGFDLPYLRQKYERYGRPFLPDSLDNMDLYRSLRPYKPVLGLPSLRQKAIEDYLGIERKDPFDGGQLIAVYEDYLATRSPLGLKALLLHNEEDVRNMPKLLAALRLDDYMKAGYTLVEQRLHEVSSLDGSARTELFVTLQSPACLPRPISLRLDCGAYLTAAETRIRLAVPLCRMTLKHFFAHAKDYFYLPEEDRAVHKSVGIYVDKEHRQKATKETCYVKKDGIFLPCPQGMEISEERYAAFHKERKEKGFYLEWEEKEGAAGQAFWEDLWNAYVHAAFRKGR